RVESEDGGSAAQFAQRDGLIRGSVQGEVRGRSARLEGLGRIGRALLGFVRTHISSSVLLRRGTLVVTLNTSNGHAARGRGAMLASSRSTGSGRAAASVVRWTRIVG